MYSHTASLLQTSRRIKTTYWALVIVAFFTVSIVGFAAPDRSPGTEPGDSNHSDGPVKVDAAQTSAPPGNAPDGRRLPTGSEANTYSKANNHTLTDFKSKSDAGKTTTSGQSKTGNKITNLGHPEAPEKGLAARNIFENAEKTAPLHAGSDLIKWNGKSGTGQTGNVQMGGEKSVTLTLPPPPKRGGKDTSAGSKFTEETKTTSSDDSGKKADDAEGATQSTTVTSPPQGDKVGSETVEKFVAAPDHPTESGPGRTVAPELTPAPAVQNPKPSAEQMVITIGGMGTYGSGPLAPDLGPNLGDSSFGHGPELTAPPEFQGYDFAGHDGENGSGVTGYNGQNHNSFEISDELGREDLGSALSTGGQFIPGPLGSAARRGGDALQANTWGDAAEGLFGGSKYGVGDMINGSGPGEANQAIFNEGAAKGGDALGSMGVGMLITLIVAATGGGFLVALGLGALLSATGAGDVIQDGISAGFQAVAGVFRDFANGGPDENESNQPAPVADTGGGPTFEGKDEDDPDHGVAPAFDTRGSGSGSGGGGGGGGGGDAPAPVTKGKDVWDTSRVAPIDDDGSDPRGPSGSKPAASSDGSKSDNPPASGDGSPPPDNSKPAPSTQDGGSEGEGGASGGGYSEEEQGGHATVTSEETHGIEQLTGHGSDPTGDKTGGDHGTMTQEQFEQSQAEKSLLGDGDPDAAKSQVDPNAVKKAMQETFEKVKGSGP